MALFCSPILLLLLPPESVPHHRDRPQLEPQSSWAPRFSLYLACWEALRWLMYYFSSPTGPSSDRPVCKSAIPSPPVHNKRLSPPQWCLV